MRKITPQGLVSLQLVDECYIQFKIHVMKEEKYLYIDEIT